MNNYDFYYPNRFRNKTKILTIFLMNRKPMKERGGFTPKQDAIIHKHFGKELKGHVYTTD